jgi:putative endonuclease
MIENLLRRVWEHKSKAVPGFTTKYGIDRLVWYEPHATLGAALLREKQLKEWKRAWKIQLLEIDNPNWIDLHPTLSP